MEALLAPQFEETVIKRSEAYDYFRFTFDEANFPGDTVTVVTVKNFTIKDDDLIGKNYLVTEDHQVYMDIAGAVFKLKSN